MLNIPGTPADHAHRTIAKHCEAVGIDPPAGVTYALEVDQALITASTPDPEGDLRAAITRGEDPKKLAANLTKAAASIAAADRIAQARQGVGRDLDMYARQALHDNAAAVLEQLRPTFDRTVAAAREAVDVIGPEHPGSDILARPAMKALWNEVVAARQHLGAIRAVSRDTLIWVTVGIAAYVVGARVAGAMGAAIATTALYAGYALTLRLRRPTNRTEQL